MAQIYEAFCRWLTLWLPDRCRMKFDLFLQADNHDLEGEFWKVLAPLPRAWFVNPFNVPWFKGRAERYLDSIQRKPTRMELIKMDDIPF